MEGPDRDDASPGDAHAAVDAVSSDAREVQGALVKQITVHKDLLGSSCDADLSGFALLISLESDDDLRTVANGGQVQHAEGYDIVFRAADDSTRLDHEIEHYDGTNGNLVAWVRIPTLSIAVDTTVDVYCGDAEVTSPTENPGGVWDSSYAGVWHLHDDYDDSTGNDNHCTNHGSGLVTGQIGDGRDFENEEDDYVDCGNGSSLDLTEAITVSAWIKPESTPAADDFYDYVTKDNLYDLQFARGTRRPRLACKIPDGDWNVVNSPDPIDTVDFHYVVGTYDVNGGDGNMKVFVDGLLADNATYSDPIESGAGPLTIGRLYADRDFDGVMDEVRISSIARDACWIETEHANQASPATFYTVTSL